MTTDGPSEAGTAPSSSSSSSHKPVSSLNAKLLAHGYAKRPLKLDRLSESEQVHVANVITELLGASVTNLSSIEDLTARHRSLEYERDRLYKSSERFETRCERLEHELAAARARSSELSASLSSEQETSRHLRGEVEKGRKALDTLRVASQQESKRAALKADKLRDQLARSIPIAPPSFQLLNPVARGASAPAPGPLPLLDRSLRDLSELRASLQEEVEAFRHVVVSTANGLREALAAAEGKEAPRLLLPADFFAGHGGKKQASSWTSHPAVADAKLRALVSDARALMTADVSPVMQDGSGQTEEQAEESERRACAERARAKAEADLRDRVKDLEVELAIARGQVEEAKAVADEVAKLNIQTVPSTTDFEDSRLREELVRQKRILDAERQQLRDEAVRLHEERTVFEAERAAAELAAVEAAKAAADAKAASEDAMADEAANMAAAAAKQMEALSLSTGPSSSPELPVYSLGPSRGAPASPPRRKHAPTRPSPLSPHHAASKKIQKAPVPPPSPRPKPKMHLAKHGKKRPSLARAVIDRQHRRSIEAQASPRIVSAGKRSASLGSSTGGGKRTASLGSSAISAAGRTAILGSGGEKKVGRGSGSVSGGNVSGSPRNERVLGEGGARGNQTAEHAGPGIGGNVTQRKASGSSLKSSSLTAGTAASLARSARKPEGALRSETAKKAWR